MLSQLWQGWIWDFEALCVCVGGGGGGGLQITKSILKHSALMWIHTTFFPLYQVWGSA